ncbi:helix-turn-helix domain-containing protein [Streptomyces sp. PsTaAH-124]|uniref:helix-turn-helix domain-containing protein n=1 Tax=Streptomyces sp. PsTaAH-124 TaxID=1157638 RepID=UPI000371A247|nr:helix-turn-helix domain-containing protein [Streptomyces sp. PsTaAH-124]
MKQALSRQLGFTEIFELPVTVDLRTAARALGICRGTAYRLVYEGTFPCSIMRVGRQYRIPTAELMRLLGIDERPMYAVDLDTVPESQQNATPA